jgi:hypothetical protein
MILDNIAGQDVTTLLAKATLLLVAALAGRVLLRRSSAAVSHLVLTLGLVAVLALPVAAVVLPAWEVTAPSFVHNAVSPGAERSPTATTATPPARLEADPPPPAATRMVDASTSAPKPRYRKNASPGPVEAAPVQPATLYRLMPGDAGISSASVSAGRSESGGAGIPWIAAIWLAGDRIGLRSLPRAMTHDRVRVPMLWGVLRPTLLLPPDWTSWSV